MVVGALRLVTDIWMAAKHCIVKNYRVNNIMNKVTRRKLGIPQSDAKQVAAKAVEDLAQSSPVTKNVESKDYTSYSAVNIKSINIGTLRKPVEQLAIYDENTKAYIPIEIKTSSKNPPRYYSPQHVSINLTNSEVLSYQTNLNVDINNPYDPLFASFERLYSLPAQTIVRSGVTGLILGDKERYYSISSGFSKSTVITVDGAADNFNRSLNGTYVPTDLIVNGRQRYLNSALPFPAAITYSPAHTGWFLSQSTVSGFTSSVGSATRGFRSLYFLNSSGLPVGTGWRSTGVANFTGSAPFPTSSQKEFEGFVKIATSKKTQDRARIYASPLGSTGVITGLTSGALPLNQSWVVYPHSYNVEHFNAFRYPVSFTFGSDFSGLKDLIVISTGESIKKIIYVSPHTVEQFQGFWSEASGTSRAPKTGVSGSIVSSRPVWVLASGNLLSVSSEFSNFTGLKFAMVSGVGGTGIVSELYNFDKAMLKQNIPLVQTPFYKLYEPIFRKNAINTGVWNGIIPSGVPFAIETLRTKNSELVSPKIEVHINQTFENISPSGSGDFQFIRAFNYEFLAGVGSFEGFANKNSSKSTYAADYISQINAKKRAKSKLKGYLWEKGLTVDNSKVKKTVKLFGTQVTSSGVIGESRFDANSRTPRYCLPYENPSDPLSCSYTGTERGAFGIPTSAGLRTLDQHSNVLPNVIDEEGNVIKFIPIIEN